MTQLSSLGIVTAKQTLLTVLKPRSARYFRTKLPWEEKNKLWLFHSYKSRVLSGTENFCLNMPCIFDHFLTVVAWSRSLYSHGPPSCSYWLHKMTPAFGGTYLNVLAQHYPLSESKLIRLFFSPLCHQLGIDSEFHSLSLVLFFFFKSLQDSVKKCKLTCAQYM